MTRATRLLRLLCLAVAGVPLVGCNDALPERAEAPAVIWRAGPPLPQPVTNNAVVALESEDGVAVFSLLGLDSTKAWTGVTDAVYRWDVGSGEGWRARTPVPGPGRLASTAQVMDGRIFLFGGYTVAEDGTERSLPNVDIYDPAADTWSRGADIPVPVDDAVSGVWRDSLVVLVSGWSDGDNVPAVQLYDPATDRWSRGTDIPGMPVFGHSGTVVGDRIVYLDGVRTDGENPRFVLDAAAWEGVLDPERPEEIAWSPLPRHPAPPLYRAAGGALGGLAVFAGGTETPYNYDGEGYDGTPAEPIRQVMAYVPATRSWRLLFAPPMGSMDHRTLGVAARTVFLVGGMEEGRVVSNKVWYADVPSLLGYQP